MYMLKPLSFSSSGPPLLPPYLSPGPSYLPQNRYFIQQDCFLIFAFVVQEKWWGFPCYPEVLFLFLRSSLLELGTLPFIHTSCTW